MTFMRPNDISLRASALVFGAMGIALAFTAPAAAQDLLSDAPLKGALTALGIVAPEKDPIEYHERAPLVVPKNMDLPQPAAAQASARNPNWPTDPDVAAKLKEKAESAQPVVRRQGGDNGGDNLPLSIWTMITGKSTNAPIQPAQIGSALGQQTISDLARQSGMSEQQLLAQLAMVLPGLVDKLSPNGRLPTQAELAAQGH